MTDRLAAVTAKIERARSALALEAGAAATFERVAGPPLKRCGQDAARAAFGSDLKAFAKKGPRAAVGYDVEQDPGRVRMVIKLRPPGIWAFGEHGAAGHLIGGGRNFRRSSSSRRPTRGQYVKAAGYPHPVRGPIAHPGTTGKGAIRYAFKLVRTAQRDAVLAGVRAVLKEV